MGMQLRQSARVLLLAFGLSAADVALAQPDIRPGLWEMQIQNMQGMGGMDMAKMQQAMEQIKAQMASMPPEQRKMMEQHLGAGAGFAMSDKGFRTCLTKEIIQRNEIPVNDGDCRHTIKEKSSKRMVATVQCSKPAINGNMTATFDNPKAYTVAIKGTIQEKGRTLPYEMSMRWLHVGDNCGNVKPFTPHQH